jgi:glutamyl-tRNA reductase
MVGAHQRSTPVAIRERLAIGPEQLSDALSSLYGEVIEACILSTCNRVEIYAVVAGPEPDPQPILRFLADHSGLAEHELALSLTALSGVEVARHACRLAAGLDSMVLGEDQIVGQLKGAMAVAQETGTLGEILNRLLQGALATGKMVRSQTGISRSQLSVVSVALNQARQTLGSLKDRQILIVGAGQTGELMLKHLRDEQAARILVANRTLARAEALTERYGVEACSFDQLPEALCAADVVLSATTAPDSIIQAAMISQVMEGRSRPLLLFDLAIPRDIEPAAGQIAGVQLLMVDDLQAICATNRAVRASEVAHAEQLVEESVGKFLDWWSARLATPTIRALRERAEAIRAAEVQRTLARLPQLSEREQAAIEALSEAIVNKLLHPPIASLKEASAGELIGAAQRLFQIEASPAACNACTIPCTHCPTQAAA